MQVGLIGAGNMARALARGWGDPVLCSDGGSGRARELVAELGGEALSNRKVAEQADIVVLCHKAYQLRQVGQEIHGLAKAVVSVLGGVSTGMLQNIYRETPVFALMPNTPVEVRRGTIVYAERPSEQAPVDTEVERQVLELFERVGVVVRVPEAVLGPATALSGVGPAYQALLVEAQVDAAVRRGLNAALASQLVAETMAGSAALLTARGYDTLAVRREVTSPGGVTARGLAALESAGIRGIFREALDAVIETEDNAR
ncbi:MAG TPA: pyrroline-5-carboxylate reductase [Solirubrobacteraceae bacterium]|jgi:pyrroline-5-carboxylate reductase